MSTSRSSRPTPVAASPSPNVAPLRVLHLLPANNGMTGVETFVAHLCAAQQRARVEPAICLEVKDREVMRDAGARMGIAVHDYPGWKVGGFGPARKIANAALRARRVRRIAALLRGVDVLHIHAVGIGGLEGLLAARIAKTRSVIVTHHATLAYFEPMRTKESDLTFWLEKRFASWSVMPYAAAREELVAAGVARERSAVIPFCVDEQRFQQRAETSKPEELRLIMAARMCEGKGHLVLLDALAQLRRRDVHARLLLVGDGPTRPEIESAIDGLGLRPFVDVLGHVSHEDMPRLFESVHVVVLPSHMQGETFPLCLLEGMAMGLPAVGSRWFGIPDIIVEGETGFVVTPRDPRALAKAIERFAVDAALRDAMGERAAERVRRSFTGAAVARAYRTLYEDALPCAADAVERIDAPLADALVDSSP